jgi:hypothetical protein
MPASQQFRMEPVSFTKDNANRCICMECPVQGKSQCARGKEKASKQGNSLSPQDVPRLYCAGGKAACGDIDTKQACICGSCPVWIRHMLLKAKPSMYFCRDGKAR